METTDVRWSEALGASVETQRRGHGCLRQWADVGGGRQRRSIVVASMLQRRWRGEEATRTRTAQESGAVTSRAWRCW